VESSERNILEEKLAQSLKQKSKDAVKATSARPSFKKKVLVE
jgi:hypothetical protein